MIWTLRTLRKRRYGIPARCRECRETIPVGNKCAGPVTNRLNRADRICVSCCLVLLEEGTFRAVSETMYVDREATTGREERRRHREEREGGTRAE